MIDHGFMDEMQVLRSNPLIHGQLPAMRSVGYRQAWEHLDHLAVNAEVAGQGDDSGWVEKAVAATRQLAKRQLTWLRGMNEVNDIACDLLSQASQEEYVLAALHRQANAS